MTMNTIQTVSSRSRKIISDDLTVLGRLSLLSIVLYILVYPFDDLLDIGAGTLTKYVGLVALVLTLLYILRHQKIKFPIYLFVPLYLMALLTVASPLYAGQQDVALSRVPININMFVLLGILIIRPYSIFMTLSAAEKYRSS